MALVDFIAVAFCLSVVLIIGCGIGSFWLASLSLFNPKIWLTCICAAPVILIAYILFVVVFILPFTGNKESDENKDI